jgi:hypothetical protein
MSKPQVFGEQLRARKLSRSALQVRSRDAECAQMAFPREEN